MADWTTKTAAPAKPVDPPKAVEVKPDPPKRGVFRVNYYVKGQAATAFVCALSDNEAAAFLGVRDGTAQVSRVAYPVEVIGIDKEHPAMEPIPVFKAPMTPTPLTHEEIAALRKTISPGPTGTQSGPTTGK